MFIAFCLANGVAMAAGQECEEYNVLRPCALEDSKDCYWDARTQGNGTGRSFVDVDGLLFTWDGVVTK